MIIRRSREHVVNLGNYESVRLGASVELSGDDVAEFDKVADAIMYADEMLGKLLAADMKEAEANVPSGQDTHLTTWQK